MVVKEVHTDRAIIRFHDTMFVDKQTAQEIIKDVENILTRAYLRRIANGEQLEKAPTV